MQRKGLGLGQKGLRHEYGEIWVFRPKNGVFKAKQGFDGREKGI